MSKRTRSYSGEDENEEIKDLQPVEKKLKLDNDQSHIERDILCFLRRYFDLKPLERTLSNDMVDFVSKIMEIIPLVQQRPKPGRKSVELAFGIIAAHYRSDILFCHEIVKLFDQFQVEFVLLDRIYTLRDGITVGVGVGGNPSGNLTPQTIDDNPNEDIVVHNRRRKVKRSVLVFGPTGSGKSSLLKSLCQVFGGTGAAELAAKFKRGDGMTPTTKTLMSIFPGGHDPLEATLDTPEAQYEIKTYLLDTPGLLDPNVSYEKFYSQFTGFLENNEDQRVNMIIYVMKRGVNTKEQLEAFDNFKKLLGNDFSKVMPHLYLCVTHFDGTRYFRNGVFNEGRIKANVYKALGLNLDGTQNRLQKGNPNFEGVYYSCKAGWGGYCFDGDDEDEEVDEEKRPHREASCRKLMKRIIKKKDSIALKVLQNMTAYKKFKEIFCTIL